MYLTYLFNIALLIILMFTNSCSKTDNEELLIKNAILEELHLHPEARLVDIYKFFFQGRFGPGHLIENKKSALSYLHNELQNATAFDRVKWQTVGYDDEYYRISLSLVKEGLLSEEELFDAFYQSAVSSSVPSVEEWIKEWDVILCVIEDMNLIITNFEGDKIILDNMLKEGRILIHHSDIYNKLYHPHYRIVNKKQFIKLDIQ